MKLSISKTGAFLNNGRSIIFIKGMKNVINYINSNNGLSVSMEVENANKFIRLFNQLNNVSCCSVESELIQYSQSVVMFRFNFKTE